MPFYKSQNFDFYFPHLSPLRENESNANRIQVYHWFAYGPPLGSTDRRFV